MIEKSILIISLLGAFYLTFASIWAIVFVIKKRYTKYFELYDRHILRKHSVINRIKQNKNGV